VKKRSIALFATRKRESARRKKNTKNAPYLAIKYTLDFVRLHFPILSKSTTLRYTLRYIYTHARARGPRCSCCCFDFCLSLGRFFSNSFASSAYLSSLLGVAVLVVLVLVFVEAATLSATTDRRVPLLRVRAVFSPQLAKRGGFLRLGQTELGDPLAVGAELVGYAQSVLLVQHRDKRELTVFVFFVFEFGEDFRIDVKRGER